MNFAEEVRRELAVARDYHPRQNSVHEGYAVLLEEVDEVWDEVKKKTRLRNNELLLKELIQVSAMAQRMAEDAGLVDLPDGEEPEPVRLMKQRLRQLKNMLADVRTRPLEAAERIEEILHSYEVEAKADGIKADREAHALSGN